MKEKVMKQLNNLGELSRRNELDSDPILTVESSDNSWLCDCSGQDSSQVAFSRLICPMVNCKVKKYWETLYHLSEAYLEQTQPIRDVGQEGMKTRCGPCIALQWATGRLLFTPFCGKTHKFSSQELKNSWKQTSSIVIARIMHMQITWDGKSVKNLCTEIKNVYCISSKIRVIQVSLTNSDIHISSLSQSPQSIQGATLIIVLQKLNQTYECKFMKWYKTAAHGELQILEPYSLRYMENITNCGLKTLYA